MKAFWDIGVVVYIMEYYMRHTFPVRYFGIKPHEQLFL